MNQFIGQMRCRHRMHSASDQCGVLRRQQRDLRPWEERYGLASLDSWQKSAEEAHKRANVIGSNASLEYAVEVI